MFVFRVVSLWYYLFVKAKSADMRFDSLKALEHVAQASVLGLVLLFTWSFVGGVFLEYAGIVLVAPALMFCLGMFAFNWCFGD